MLLYFDCFSGISGDMTLGALIDLGVPVPWLKEKLAGLPLSGFDITAADVEYNGIHAKKVEVTAKGHEHRDYAHIRDMIAKSPLAAGVRQTALGIFARLAAAEAGVHGCTPEEVHFHEIGGVDAIVDVVGAALCLDYIGVTLVAASPVPTGSGFVECRHGRLPIPAPATAALLKGIPVHGSDVAWELTTPTGAAIVTGLARSFGPIPPMTLKEVGYGAGSRNLDPGPNLLRILIGEPAQSAAQGVRQERIQIVEAGIDDMNPELFGFVMERLFEAGALDVCWIPIHMKKNRPGTLLQALCATDRLNRIVECILTETSTLGVRHYEAGRHVLAREIVTVETSFGPIPVKRVSRPPHPAHHVPEYEVCRRIALERNLPLRRVYETVLREANPGQKPGPNPTA
ncbi:MAG: nickel pincer cofactor biosynthesis protein LarC [Desulfobacterales bacterium]